MYIIEVADEQNIAHPQWQNHQQGEAMVIGATKIGQENIEGHQKGMAVRLLVQQEELAGVYPVHPRSGKKGILDIACGIGGFAAAAEFLGMKMIGAIEKNQKACEAYAANFQHRMIQGDMGDSWTLYHAIELKPEAVTMGFSCQPFSRMGAQKGTQDERAG
eukprot:4955218-Karenia_brevis.AAC.1